MFATDLLDMNREAPLVGALASQLSLVKRRNGMRADALSDSREMGRGKGFQEAVATGLETDQSAVGEPGADVEWLAEQVEALLPWRDRNGLAVAMAVVEAGFAERDHVLFPAGTPCVIVAVDSWEAAEAVYDALEPIARLDEDGWTLGWVRSTHGFRQITIFPTVETLMAVDADQGSEAA